MDFSEWEPIYEGILRDFGFSREEDERAAKELSKLAAKSELCDDACLGRTIGSEVTVCGDAPSLERSLMGADLRGTVIAADGATSTLLHSLGRVPDIIVTDLDGDVSDQLSANAQGSIVVVHAHGDNREVIRRFVPRFQGRLVLTTQSRPFGVVRNFGGFTDGDRAVALARHFKAAKITLMGFDFDEPRPKPEKDPQVKLRKLAWAKKIIFDHNTSQTELIVNR